MLLHHFDGVIHLLMALPHCQAADGIAGQIQRGDLLHVGHADIMEHRPLVDAEKHLPRVHRVLPAVVVGQSRLAALQPADGTIAGFLHIVPGRGDLDALVKGHGNIRAQIGLDAHAFLRPHKNVPPVHMGIEADALLLDLPQLGQGKDLEAATVGEDGAVPVHELVQAAHLLDQRVAGAHMKVVGVGKLHLAADGFQVVGGEGAFDGPLGAHIHEHRGLDGAVGRFQLSPAGLALLFDQLKHALPPHSINMASPKEKKRYRSFTASS